MLQQKATYLMKVVSCKASSFRVNYITEYASHIIDSWQDKEQISFTFYSNPNHKLYFLNHYS